VWLLDFNFNNKRGRKEGRKEGREGGKKGGREGGKGKEGKQREGGHGLSKVLAFIKARGGISMQAIWFWN
jgi:hypothetical protein